MHKIYKTFDTYSQAESYLNSNFNGHGAIYNTYNGECLKQCRCPNRKPEEVVGVNVPNIDINSVKFHTILRSQVEVFGYCKDTNFDMDNGNMMMYDSKDGSFVCQVGNGTGKPIIVGISNERMVFESSIIPSSYINVSSSVNELNSKGITSMKLYESISEIVKNDEWQTLRKSLLGKWKSDPQGCCAALRRYVTPIVSCEINKLRRVWNYLTGSGFRIGVISHPCINQLKKDINFEIKKRGEKFR